MLEEQHAWLPAVSMKAFFIIMAVLVIGGSLFADYKWRRWMDARRREHEDHHDPRR
jgi:hypothetical protein